jgi:hypothetical protein
VTFLTGEGSPQVAEKVTHEAPITSGIQEVDTNVCGFFSEDGIFFIKLDFLAVICGI